MRLGFGTIVTIDGPKASRLPVVQATEYELAINLKTAKALSLDVPNTLIGRADQLVE